MRGMEGAGVVKVLCFTGFSTGTRMSEVEFGSGINVGDGGRKVSVMTVPGQEMTIARYTLAPDHPHLLPFTLTGSTAALTPR